MKTRLLTLIVIAALSLSTSAQSKKELQENIARLSVSVDSLKNRTILLESELRTITAEKKLAESQLQMERDKVKTLTEQLSQAKSGASASELEGNNENETAIYTLVHNYFASKTWSERFNYVVQSEETKNDMKRLFLNGAETYTVEAKDLAILTDDISTEGKDIAVNYWGNDARSPAIVVKTKDGYKIDFAKTHVYNRDGLNKLSKGFTGEKVIKVWVNNITDNNEWWWEMSADDASQTFATLFFPKDASFASQLLKLVDEEGRKALTLRIKSDNESGIIIKNIEKVGY